MARNRIRITLLAMAGLAALQAAWILALIPYFGIDEFDHGMRASAVVNGQVLAPHKTLPGKIGRGDLIEVRPDVVRTARPACEARAYTQLYNCRPWRELANGKVVVANAAARYNPTYYAAVGIIAEPFHGMANLYALRIATAGLGCALFGLAVWIAASSARSRWQVVAVIVGATPTTIYSTTVVSPNGIELVAGIGLWVSTFALLDREGDGRRRLYYGSAALFAAVLTNTHTLGILCVGLIAATLLLLYGGRALWRALRPWAAAEGIVAVLGAAAIGFGIAWILVSGANDPSLEHSKFGGQPWSYLAQGLVLWPLQAIGAFPLRNEAAPLITYAFALTVISWLVVRAIRTSGIRSRPAAAILVAAVASLLVPAALTWQAFDQIGPAWQGRYGMPFSVGLIIMAGRILDSGARIPHWDNFAAGTCLGVVAAIELPSLIKVVNDQGSSTSLIADTGWTAPATVLLAVAVAAAAACWVALVRDTGPEVDVPA